MHVRTMLAPVLLATVVAGIVRASAALGGAGVASADTVVVSPPVEVSGVHWETEFTSGQYRMKSVKVDFRFTDSFDGYLRFGVAATGGSPSLPKTKNDLQQFSGAVAGDIVTVTLTGGLPPRPPISSIEDLHLMVCDYVVATPAERCSKLPGP